VGLSVRVLIVAKDDSSAGALADGLDRLGWRTVTARDAEAGARALADLEIEAAVVDLADAGESAVTLAETLRAACRPRRLPIVALASPEAPSAGAFDLVLGGGAHPAQLALRLEQLVRAAVSEEEFELRGATFAERNARLELPSDADTSLSVLVIGSPAPQVLALTNALGALGLDCVAAFTPYTAFDYLHDRRFDAVALWGGEDQAEAISIAAGMRRNTRLFHVPTLLYLRRTEDLDFGEVFKRGITDVASLETAEARETALRIAALGRAYRRQSAIRQALENARGSGLMDASTGLFTRDLFASHLARLGSAARERKRPLSVCVLRVADRPDLAQVRAGGWLDRAMPQIGSMIARLVRAEDTAARLASEIFALALPATPLGHARLVGDRIAAVIACTAFESGPGRTPFVVEFDVGVAEVHPGESAALALERAAQAATEQRAAG
jgi:two-component system, cell cycle response regulator PopA